jgi:uncharacterized protein YbaP (TraB family)
MRRLSCVILVFVVLLFNASTNAQNKDMSGGKGLLWRVRSQTSTIYILGSIHYLRKDNYPLNSKIEDAFNKSSVLAVEADVNNVDMNELGSLMTRAIYEGDDSLDKHVSTETLDLLTKESNRLGLMPDIFMKQRPWFIAMSLEAFELMKMGYDPDYGIDKHFLNEAGGKKRIVELESISSQIDLMAGFSDSEQEALLFYTLKDMDKIEKMIDTIVAAWNAGDAKRFSKLMSEETEKEPKLSAVYDKLITRRNRDMALKIENMLQAGDSCFVVIGAAHLVGDSGIIKILKEKGYAIEQR